VKIRVGMMFCQRKIALAAMLSVLFLFGMSGIGNETVDASVIVKQTAAAIRFQESLAYGNMRVVPVNCRLLTEKSAGLLTLDEAVKRGVLRISELNASGEVNRLTVENHGKNPVFIMAGEILRGSKQDRILQQDILVPAPSGKLIVEAFCVEQGRWHPESEAFYSEGKQANIAVRQAAKSLKRQDSVWESVSETNAKMAAEAPTQSLSASFRSDRFHNQADPYRSVFGNLPNSFPDATGVVILIDGTVLAADFFAERRLFKALWKKLLDSYIVEAISRQGVQNSIQDHEETRSFIQAIQRSRIQKIVTVGLGVAVEISSSQVSGSALLYQRQPVHLDLFPQAGYGALAPVPERIQRRYHR